MIVCRLLLKGLCQTRLQGHESCWNGKLTRSCRACCSAASAVWDVQDGRSDTTLTCNQLGFSLYNAPVCKRGHMLQSA